MPDEQVIDTAVLSAIPAEVAPESQESDQEAAGIAQERAENGQHKRLGGWQRKLRKAEAETNFWKEKAIQEGHAPLSDEISADEWMKRANARVRNGLPLASAAAEPEPELEAELAKLDQEEAPVEAPVKAEAEKEPDAPQPLTEEEIRHFESHEKFVRTIGRKIALDPEFKEAAAAISAEGAPASLLNFIGQTLADVSNGPDVLKVLGQNPELLRTMWKMEPKMTGMMLEEIAADLAAEADQDAPETRVKPPAPISPVRKVAPTATGLSDDLSTDEWMRRRQAQDARKREGR
jgi:hypothetical protein